MTEKEKKKLRKQTKKANKLLIVKLCKEFAQRLILEKEKTYKDNEEFDNLTEEWQSNYKELMVLSMFMHSYPEIENEDLFIIVKKNKCKFLLECFKDNVTFIEDLCEFGANEMFYRIQEQSSVKELN